MSRETPAWAVLVYIVATMLILFSIGPASCAVNESSRLRRMTDAEFPVTEVDLSQPGVTSVKLGPFERQSIWVTLIVPGEAPATEQTLGNLTGTLQMVQTSDGAISYEWRLEELFWYDNSEPGPSLTSEEAAIGLAGFHLPSSQEHELRLTIVEPAAELGAGRLQVDYVIDSMDGAFIGLWWMMSGALAIGGVLLVIVVLLIRRRGRLRPDPG